MRMSWGKPQTESEEEEEEKKSAQEIWVEEYWEKRSPEKQHFNDFFFIYP